MAVTSINGHKNYSSCPLHSWLAEGQVKAEIIQAFEA
jgi:hypothetical protein